MCNICWLLISDVYNIYHLDRLLVALWSTIIRFSYAEERLNQLMVFGKFPFDFCSHFVCGIIAYLYYVFIFSRNNFWLWTTDADSAFGSICLPELFACTVQNMMPYYNIGFLHCFYFLCYVRNGSFLFSFTNSLADRIMPFLPSNVVPIITAPISKFFLSTFLFPCSFCQNFS